jgi:hypothetical protein
MKLTGVLLAGRHHSRRRRHKQPTAIISYCHLLGGRKWCRERLNSTLSNCLAISINGSAAEANAAFGAIASAQATNGSAAYSAQGGDATAVAVEHSVAISIAVGTTSVAVAVGDGVSVDIEP